MAQSSAHENAGNGDDDGYDPVTAFEQRRQIFLSVQEMQRLEHEMIRRIADMTTSRKRELLQILSDWLLSQDPLSSVKPEQRREAENLSGCNLEEWLRLQEQAARLQDEVDRCQREADTAQSEYKDAAPLGHVGMGAVNRWLADGERKSKLQSLEAAARQKAAARDGAAGRLAANVKERQEFGKRFLRGCLGNLRRLEASRVFGDRARTLVGEMTRTIESEWLSHLRATQAGMGFVEENLRRLRWVYRLGSEE